ncbi:hypothetical protein [Cyanobium sp. N5-Cardenillas]|uniref:hypothetical protein n=1 Tax=Cyanobium sp. N5-Cardenillas TaxID=2823720 RepID=UPI0020CD6EB3|nr:hypothetical protein [Cyanobium sp. N5-Cardenillas]MCP9786006.1 hypothetical protein [Cyanobium sp. N5-Cardenillas]
MARTPAPRPNEVGIAGEFYVLHMLARLGYSPALTLGNTKGVDILVTCPSTSRVSRVEVKTSADALRAPKDRRWWTWLIGWPTSAPNQVFCFVHLGASVAETRCFLFQAADVIALEAECRAAYAAEAKDEAQRQRRLDPAMGSIWFYEDEKGNEHGSAWHLIDEAMTAAGNP